MAGFDDRMLKELLPFPAKDANKYTRGKLILTVGSAAYPGAACLASTAAQMSGAGYCEVFTCEDNVRLLQLARPSLVVRAFSSLVSKTQLDESREGRPVAYLAGSGFDAQDEQAAEVLRCVLGTRAPLVVDGGALGMVASDEDVRSALCERAGSGNPTVLTPHGGEAAKLAAAVGMDNFDKLDQTVQASALARSYDAVVVLKGPDTVISDGMDSFVMTEGTAALAKAGTGDVLAGMLGALLAQGMDPFDASVLAATLHARAGALAEDQLGVISVCPEDVVHAIPGVLKSLEGASAAPLGFTFEG